MMATTFDTPVLVTKVSEGRYRIFRGGGIPPAVPLKVPTSLHGFYQITGALDAYHRLLPPPADVSRDEVLARLEGARRLGCEVKVGHFALEGLPR